MADGDCGRSELLRTTAAVTGARCRPDLVTATHDTELGLAELLPTTHPAVSAFRVGQLPADFQAGNYRRISTISWPGGGSDVPGFSEKRCEGFDLGAGDLIQA